MMIPGVSGQADAGGFSSKFVVVLQRGPEIALVQGE
jgi:hypothetical protein